MPTHGRDTNHPINRMLRRKTKETREQDRFPDGKMNDQDEGELMLAAGIEDGEVIIRFGKPIAWIGMTPEGAAQLAEILLEKARKAGFTGVFEING